MNTMKTTNPTTYEQHNGVKINDKNDTIEYNADVSRKMEQKRRTPAGHQQ